MGYLYRLPIYLSICLSIHFVCAYLFNCLVVDFSPFLPYRLTLNNKIVFILTRLTDLKS